MAINDPDDQLSALMSLASRPVYRRDFPMLWRETGHLVIWSGSSRVVLDRMDSLHANWLRSLDGLRTWQEVICVPENVPTGAARIIRALQVLGALDDATDMPQSWRWLSECQRDRQRGDLAAAAHTYPKAREAITALEKRHATGIAVIGSNAMADELRDAMQLAGLRVIEPETETPTEEANRSIVIFANGVHPDIIDDVDTPLHEHPHLPVTAYGARAVVGPLVIPGVTSCLRCAYLHTVDADAMWPMLTLQLASQIRRLATAPIDRLLTRAAAVQAALLVRAWLDQPSERMKWRDIAFELRLPMGSSTPIPRPSHPLCGCAWAQDSPVSAAQALG